MIFRKCRILQIVDLNKKNLELIWNNLIIQYITNAIMNKNTTAVWEDQN